jgi:hypothetical protein
MTFDHCSALKGIEMPIERVLLMESSLSRRKLATIIFIDYNLFFCRWLNRCALLLYHRPAANWTVTL